MFNRTFLTTPFTNQTNLFCQVAFFVDKPFKETLGKLEPLSCSSSCIDNYTIIVIYLSIIIVQKKRTASKPKTVRLLIVDVQME